MGPINFNLDPFAIVIVGLILVFGLRSWWESSQQTSALKRMADAEEKQYFLKVFEYRTRAAKTIEDINIEDWLTEQSGFKFLSIDTVLNNPKAISFLAKKTSAYGGKNSVVNVKVVVSPLRPLELKRELAKVEGKNTIERKVPLLGYKKPFSSTPSFERNLLNGGGIWFDTAAGKVGEKFGVDWGNPERLNFYIVSI